jgi:hypothetical protein
VRRKVLELERLGWVEKHESGYLVVSKRAAGELSPVTTATFKYLVAVGAACVKAASREQSRHRRGILSRQGPSLSCVSRYLTYSGFSKSRDSPLCLVQAPALMHMWHVDMPRK